MNPRDAGFNAHEKVEILAEIIKAGNIHPDMLLQIIRNHGITPDWGNVALPRGRTLNQCVNWYNSVMPQAGPSGPTSGIVRSQSVRDLGPTLKRSFNPDSSFGGGRPIVPKPATSNIGNLLNEPPSFEPPRKKRGRPTKLEIEARREAALARGEMLPAPIPPPVPIAGPSLATVAAQRAMTPRPPEPPGSAGLSESSSGKKRGRPSKADMEARRLHEEAMTQETTTRIAPAPPHYPNILLSAESDERESGEGRLRQPQDSPSRPDPTGFR